MNISQLNVELTSRCTKKTTCFMCGHQDRKTNPNLQFGDMDFSLVESIERQIDAGVIVSLHRDGDSVDYPRLGDALRVFKKHPISLVTHGERLGEKAEEIIGACTTVTVSVIPNDPDRLLQIQSIAKFLALKGDKGPMVQLKCVGNVDDIDAYRWLRLPIIGRSLHKKQVNQNYQSEPPVPEIRVCLDMLFRPTVDWRGRVFACNRLDPNDAGLIGDLTQDTLQNVLNGPVRARMIKAHLSGHRELANALCASCRFWGISAS